MTVLAGMSANAAELADQLKKLTPHAHAMRASESRIDQSGQGFFLWLSIESLRPMASMALAAPDKKFANDIVTQTRSVALGWGTVNGKGRVKPARRCARREAAALSAAQREADDGRVQRRTALGRHDVVADRGRTRANPAGHRRGFRPAGGAVDGRRAWPRSRITSASTRKTCSPRSVRNCTVIGDDAGTYSAVRLRDAAKFNALIEQLVAKFKLAYETRDIAGIKIHYLTVPNFGAAALRSGGDSPWLDAVRRISRHYYWIETPDNLLFADIPQTLIDYHNAKSHEPVGAWLTQRQGLDDKQSLLSMSARTQNTQRALYAMYLQGLQALADISGAKIDLFAMPSADQIALPRNGALGLQIHASNDDAGIDFVFEQSPVEVLTSSSGSMMPAWR